MQATSPRATTPPAGRRAPRTVRAVRWLRAAPRRFGLVALAALVLVAALWITYRFVEPAPPDSLTVSTGEPGGAHHRNAAPMAETFAAEGIELRLLPSEGSVENLERLGDGAADVPFLQSGLAGGRTGTVPNGSEGLASLYFEPVWIFVRAEGRPVRLDALAGRRVAVGRPGSGTRLVALRLPAESGVDEADAELLAMGTDAAAEALLAGDIDAAFVISAPEAPVVERPLAADGVLLLDLERAAGRSRRHAWLNDLVLPAGVLDFERDLPPADVGLLGVAATLVAREDPHPAPADLVMRAAGETFRTDALFSEAGQIRRRLDGEPGAAPALSARG